MAFLDTFVFQRSVVGDIFRPAQSGSGACKPYNNLAFCYCAYFEVLESQEAVIMSSHPISAMGEFCRIFKLPHLDS